MRHYRFVLFIFVLILIGAIVAPFGLMRPVRDATYRVLTPITSTMRRIGGGATGFVSTISSLGNLLKDNEYLRNRNIELQAEIVHLKESNHENELLRKELQFLKESGLQLIPSRIIARSPSGFMDTMIINRGMVDGVKDGQAIISHGFLVGRVRHTNTNTSEILLITSSLSKIPGLMQESRGNGLVHGGLKGLRLEDVQSDVAVKIGETVVTSDLGQLLPAGIPIGTVKEIISPESDIAQSASISSPISFYRLEMVFIVK